MFITHNKSYRYINKHIYTSIHIHSFVTSNYFHNDDQAWKCHSLFYTYQISKHTHIHTQRHVSVPRTWCVLARSGSRWQPGQTVSEEHHSLLGAVLLCWGHCHVPVTYKQWILFSKVLQFNVIWKWKVKWVCKGWRYPHVVPSITKLNEVMTHIIQSVKINWQEK